MSFHNVSFPTDVSYGSLSGPRYRVSITELDSGAERRVNRWPYPRHSYNVGYGIKSYTQLQNVVTFYHAREGPTHSFRLKDWVDYSSNTQGNNAPGFADQVIGTGDGTKTAFQLIKRYVSGVTTKVRNIKLPVLGTVRVFHDGVEVTTGWSVSDTTGEITYTTAPASGITITASFEFEVAARFAGGNEDILQVSQDNFGSGSIPSLELIEVQQEESSEDDYPYGNADEISINADTQITQTRAIFYAIYPSTAGLAAVLPDKADVARGGASFYVKNLSPLHTLALKESSDDGGATIATLPTLDGVTVVISESSGGTRTWWAF